MLTRAEARRMERLELDAIDALASLWAAAHPVATLDASTSVVAARLPRLQPAPDVPRKEKTGTDATIRRDKPILPMTTGPNKATKMASFTRRDLRKAALKLINKAKRDGPLNALYDLKHGVDRALRDLNDPKRPRMVCKCRLELEISVLKEIKKELVVRVPKPKLKPWSVNGITKVIYLPSS